MLDIRPFRADDRQFVQGLAARLTIGMPAWRDPQLCLAAVQGWIAASIEQHGKQTMIFVAEDQGERLGFASVTHETHFSGEDQAYIGELATSAAAEGRGVGTALLQACEQWARDRGYRILTLTTGAANRRARSFYQHRGYTEEDIKLTKLLDEPASDDRRDTAHSTDA